MDGIRSFALVGLIIAACGHDSAARGVGWVMALVGSVCIAATRLLEAIAGMVTSQ